ncbi:peptide/nickel transport system substrate-binding protein [Hamadaea flava]|uniref:ABC transporter substrate-binding protein n=1 Tax=Hamadaea flava TaxID=1742688 RepID=A0ABV8LUG6_9ACTN|nr:ABC transporter substrate-binding protein [Hamadaea flava]MCP2328193.1 peptide/nickel transport system substrate-binding protein [Hamadaea flava]
MSLSRRQFLGTTAGAGIAAFLAACAEESAKPPAERILNVFAGASGQFTENYNQFAPTPLNGTRGLIYEPLFFFNQAKADDVQPLLATKYEFGDGGKTLTFTLREGVQWNDGKPFTAEDVAFNFLYRKNNPALNANGTNIVDATVVDAKTVKITFKDAVYTELWNIAGRTYMVPKHIWEPIADPTKEVNANPVGTGPFVKDSFASQSYVLKKNPKYWDSGKPKIAGLRFWSFTGNDAATTALASGQLDWAGIFIPDIQGQFISKDSAHNKFKNESFLYVTNLIPNLTKPLFADPAVRQAINVALDRQKIIKLAFADLGAIPSPLQLVVPTFAGYVSPKHAEAKVEYNPDKAKQLLEGAGWAKGADGIYAKNGKKLSFTCSLVTGWTDYEATMQVVQQLLKEVGIEFKPNALSYNAFIAALQSGDFDMAIYNAWGGPSPYFMYYNICSTKSIPPANQNNARWKNAKVDAALAAIAATPPDQTDAIKQQIYAIQDEIVADTPYIPIQQSSSLAEFRTLHATGWPSEENPYALALPFSEPDCGIVAKNLNPA